MTGHAPIHVDAVFTPSSLPTVTDVDRTNLSKKLSTGLKTLGQFTLLNGRTKLGKTTLLTHTLRSLEASDDFWFSYMPGQNVASVDDFWKQLASQLGIPVSREANLASSNTKSWNVSASMSAALATLKARMSGGVSGADTTSTSSKETFDILPNEAVLMMLEAYKIQGRRSIIAIDDFHFIQDVDLRRQILVALRPVAEQLGTTILLSSLPGRESDPAFRHTQLAGRRKRIEVPAWGPDELSEIASLGFEELRLRARDGIVDLLVSESFGSPQLMQMLCLSLCRDVNDIETRCEGDEEEELATPPDWDEFFRSQEDDETLDRIRTFARGPAYNGRAKHSIVSFPPHPEIEGSEVDGYQLIMLGLCALANGEPVKLSEISTYVLETILKTTDRSLSLNLPNKLDALGKIAQRELDDWLDDNSMREVNGDHEDSIPDEVFDKADKIPQPLIGIDGRGVAATITIYDPLFHYMLKWHPDSVI